MVASSGRSRRAVLTGAAVLAAAGTLPRASFAQTPAKVTVGGTGSATDVGLWIADKLGYFSQENIVVDFITMDSAARMVPLLASGEIDVGAGAHSAGLFNAVARGLDIRIVSDKSKNVTGRGSQKLLVRKDLVDSGRYKTYADLKGMKIAGSAPGNGAATVVLKFLAAGHLTPADVDQVYMAFPQMVAAFQNKAIDAALPAEPSVTEALRTGTVVAVGNDYDVYPVHQISELLYSGKFATKDPDLAKRFLRAFLRGVRFENDALAPDGSFTGAKGDQVVSILTEYGPFKDPAVWRSFILSACDPDGTLHVPSIEEDLAIFKSQGLIEGKVDLSKVIDTSFRDWAVAQLGPYKRA